MIDIVLIYIVGQTGQFDSSLVSERILQFYRDSGSLLTFVMVPLVSESMQNLQNLNCNLTFKLHIFLFFDQLHCYTVNCKT